jgi:hypothetical protein
MLVHPFGNADVFSAVVPPDTFWCTIHQPRIMEQLHDRRRTIVVVDSDSRNKSCFTVDERMNEKLEFDKSLTE